MDVTQQPKYLPSGDTALVIEFGEHVDATLSGLVLGLAERVEAAAIPGVVEVVPTFRSLMVHYDPLRLTQRRLKDAVAPLVGGLTPLARAGRRWRIPACYEGDLGLDLAEVAARTGMSPAALVTCHSGAVHRVYMMGFLPGFAYLGGLPGVLNIPRRETPRLSVPRGSVAIAMAMTCIYSFASPGGWHVLARTPVPLWDLRADPPAPLAAGDEVVFDPISLGEFERLASAAGEGARALQREVGPKLEPYP